jgi:curved DNA-binding protein CbpA
MDAYATLGLPASVSLTEARRAYRAHLRAFHPDTGSGNTTALATVRAAYRELERTLRADATRAVPSPHVDVYA